MQTRSRNPFATVHTEGAVLPADLLQRIADRDESLGGLTEAHYHLGKSDRLREAISGSWNRLTGRWETFRDEMARLRERPDLYGTTETREGWLLPLFQELGYGRLLTRRAYEIDGKTYPVSHEWHHTPIHLVSFKVDLDRRTAGVAGAATSAPHAMVQVLLNRSDEHLWAFLSNGLKLRLLRDNASLTRQAYVEFDLEAMMEGEAFADFALLWMLCHQSRVESDVPEACWLERWSQAAAQEGTRALDALRNGVEEAIAALGSGFVAHPGNTDLRERLREGHLEKQDYYRQLLRLVYRLIFLFTAEDRDLLLDPEADDEARDRYARFYAASRLRMLAEKQRGSERHVDLLRSLRVVMQALGRDDGEPNLGLPGLGSFLWSEDAIADLHGSDLPNARLLDAVRALTFIEHDRRRRPVDYKNLGPEELGSIYESLLELQPAMNLEAGTFRLEVVAGSERKTTGSYYTPDSLIQCLLDTALDPLLEEAERADDPAQALLGLKVCDPACGSGHFLIAAAHRIARRLAAARTGDEQPTPDAVRHALRDVIGHCVYGVDLNPMAVELCKVNLWLEALEPGKPLSFLDHHIKVGNSLLGATPARIKEGIPNDAFKTITGDDKDFANEYKAQNRTFRREQQYDLFAAEPMPWERLGNMPAVIAELESLPDDSVAAVREKQARYEAAVRSQAYEHARLLADAWCAAFVWKKRPSNDLPYPIHEEIFRRIERNPYDAPHWMKQEIQRLADQYRFFHWYLAFPDVFRVPVLDEKPDDELAGWKGGFSLIVGNPPWDQIQLDPREFFAGSRPSISEAPNMTTRQRMIEKLAEDDPGLYFSYWNAQRENDGVKHFIHASGMYPLTSYGRLNTASLFAELSRHRVALKGRIGVILPSGIATDSFNQYFFQDIMNRGDLCSLYSFWEIRRFFPGTDSRNPFCLLTLSFAAEQDSDFLFDGKTVSELKNEDRHFTLTATEIALLNPNTRTCPIFRSKRDAKLTKVIYRRMPVLVQEGPPEQNPWSIKFMIMFMMNTDSGKFRTYEQLREANCTLEDNYFICDNMSYLPLYEAKMIHHFDHRFATYQGSKTQVMTNLPKQGANFKVLPRYWVSMSETEKKLGSDPSQTWQLGFRRICRTTDERSSIFTVLPGVATGDSIFLVISEADNNWVLVSCFNSFAFDFVARQKVGGSNFNFYLIKQLPVLPPDTYTQPCPWSPADTLADWLQPRTLELTYTAWDLEAFARDCGYDGPPFRWNEERRRRLRVELDAAFFHLYLGTPAAWSEEPEALRDAFSTPRAAVAYIMETFPIVKRKDVQAFGDYRTKTLILQVYDQMQEAIDTGATYQTILSPPPADPSVAHPAREGRRTIN